MVRQYPYTSTPIVLSFTEDTQFELASSYILTHIYEFQPVQMSVTPVPEKKIMRTEITNLVFKP